MKTIYILGVNQIQPAHSLSQSEFIPGNGNNMNMIRHQAIGLNFKTELFRLFFESGEVHLSVVVGKEDVLSVASSLSDVMRKPR